MNVAVEGQVRAASALGGGGGRPGPGVLAGGPRARGDPEYLVAPDMAPTAGSPDIHTRALPSAWTSLDSGPNLQEALDALESYKKKDPSKGAPTTPAAAPVLKRVRSQWSCGSRPWAMRRL